MQLAQAISIFAGNQGWVGFDFDQTLAKQTKYSPTKLGAPNPKVVAKLKEHLAKGDTVKIFTARAADPHPGELEAIQNWCKVHVGRVLPITNEKDPDMKLLYDDRARQVRMGEIKGGGPGSGCNGPNCGRPLGSGKNEIRQTTPASVREPRTDVKSSPIVTRYQLDRENQKVQEATQKATTPKTTPAERKMINQMVQNRERRPLPPPGGERHYADEFKRATKEYKKQVLKPSLKQIANWQSKIGEWKGLSPDEIHKLKTTEPGDRGATLEKIKAWDERVGAVKTYPMGTKVGIENVIPPTGGTPPLFTVRFPGGGSAHVPLDSVYIEKRLDAPKIDPAKVRDADVVTRGTKDGADYTIVRSQGQRAEETAPRTIEHGLKGEFQNVTGTVKGLDDPDRKSVVYFARGTSGNEAEGSQWVKQEDGSFKQLGEAGTTVFVHYYPSARQMTIQEVNTGQYGARFGNTREWKYKNLGKTNLGQAAGLLNKRFGISVKGLK